MTKSHIQIVVDSMFRIGVSVSLTQVFLMILVECTNSLSLSIGQSVDQLSRSVRRSQWRVFCLCEIDGDGECCENGVRTNGYGVIENHAAAARWLEWNSVVDVGLVNNFESYFFLLFLRSAPHRCCAVRVCAPGLYYPP